MQVGLLIKIIYRMFKTDLGLTTVTKKLMKEEGMSFMLK
jgi:hypothetical protein